MSESVKWKLKDKTELTFEPLKPSDEWNEVAGLYLFANLKNSVWGVHYVGQTNNFKSRIPTHERWNDAKKLGATHVLAALVPLQAKRDKYEEELIQELQPSLNTQLK